MIIQDIQAFISFYNFYRQFVKDYKRITKPLNNLTRKGVPFDFD
jgi:hypothetical protein